MRRSSLTSSSLPLQVLIYFDVFFSWLWIAASLVLLVYKGDQFPYPGDILAAEVVGVLLVGLVTSVRLKLGGYGNKTQRVWPTLGFLFLTCVVILSYVYFLTWQTYVTRVDLILNAMGLVFVSLEALLSVFTVFVFFSHRSSMIA